MAKKTLGKNAQWESLAKELRNAIPNLDVEGLAFLVEQARVHLYNMEVDKHNNAVLAESKAGKSRSKAAAVKQSKPAAYKIVGTESGSSYYLHCPGDEVMFSKGEMVQLTKIANGKGTDLEIRERLYNWIERERRDVFSALPVKNKADERLGIVASLIRKNFKLR